MADEEGEAPVELEGEENVEEVEAEAVALEEDIEEDHLDESSEDPFEMLDETNEDNEEEHRMYREYLNLAKEIDCQNALINDMKERVRDLCAKSCPTSKDKDEVKHLRICLDKDYIKLNSMINRAVQLQNYGSKRRYDSLELATSNFEEMLLPDISDCEKIMKYTPVDTCPRTAQQICDALDDAEVDSDDDCCCPKNRT